MEAARSQCLFHRSNSKVPKTVLETTRFKTRGTNVSPGLLEKRDFESLVPVPTKTLILEERRTHHGMRGEYL